MRIRGRARTRAGRVLGVVLVTLSLVHAPFPEPDFHNIRHHDGQGEVCEYHDHLLRWHPGAGVAEDVAVLHWHWFWPAPGADDPIPENSGLAVHAHVPDWSAPPWDSGPLVTSLDVSRPDLRPTADPPSLLLFILLPDAAGVNPAIVPRPASTFGATFAPRVPLTSLLHRWVC